MTRTVGGWAARVYLLHEVRASLRAYASVCHRLYPRVHGSVGVSDTSGGVQKPGGFLASERGSANHLIRQEEQRWRQRDLQGLGGLEVEDQLEFHGLFHRQLGGLGSVQDLMHVGGS